jgi:outer membrane lipoprotein SlyB
MILLPRFLTLGLSSVAFAALAGCAPDYSPNTYNSGAVQQANKVESAIVVGFRQVEISAAGTVGAVTGGAAGGILGAQAGPTNAASALGAVGGGVVGSLVGTGIEHATADTTGWEYIVRKSNGDLLSVTQREPQPIPLGQKVLVITGSQARIIPDYSIEPTPPTDRSKDRPGEGTKPAPAATPEPAAPTAGPPAPVTPTASGIDKTPLAPPEANQPPVPPMPAADDNSPSEH